MKIVASGMSGFIGRPLLERLKNKHEVVCLKRRGPAKAGEVLWDPAVRGEWMRLVDGADAVLNLSGEPIAGKRWTKAQKKELITSRLNTVRALADAMSAAQQKPKVFVSASAIGFYGDRGNEPVTEASAPGSGFLPDVCREWERQALKAESLGIRTVLLRTGVVLGRNGGALAKMLPPFKMGIGGPLGNGRQVLSWIHMDDELSAIEYALENPSLRGPVNLTSPEPATMSEFARALGKALKRPALFAVPAPVLKILLGEMSEMLLTGQRVMPEALQKSGFKFRFQGLGKALEDLVTG